MLLSHECPRDLMSTLGEYNDYNYYLEVFHLDKSYNDFYRSSNKITYLDNSLYERTMANTIEKLDIGMFKALTKKLLKDKIDVYCIIPDYKDNSKKCIKELNHFKGIKKKIVGVHGKTYDEYKDCYNYYKENLDMENTIIALSTLDDFNCIDSRVKFLSENDITGVKIHCFGLQSIEELKLLSTVKDKIYSLDSSLPVTATIVGKEIDKLDAKPKLLIYNIFNKPTSIDLGLLKYNIDYVRNYLK